MILIISDETSRSAKIVAALNLKKFSYVYEVGSGTHLTGTFDLIICDVSQLESKKFVEIKRLLFQVRGVSTPLLFLMYGNIARAEMQARILGASEVLVAKSAVDLLKSRLERRKEKSNSLIPS